MGFSSFPFKFAETKQSHIAINKQHTKFCRLNNDGIARRVKILNRRARERKRETIESRCVYRFSCILYYCRFFANPELDLFICVHSKTNYIHISYCSHELCVIWHLSPDVFRDMAAEMCGGSGNGICR